MDLDGETYNWIKALHMIAVIAWMAGLLYLPRLFVYHADVAPGSDQSETFKVMERRLLRAIMNPAMIVALALGIVLILALGPEIWQWHWFQVKVACIIPLLVIHMMMGKWRREFAEDRNQHPAKFYRIMNEVPTVLMIIIVIMVVVEPF